MDVPTLKSGWDLLRLLLDEEDAAAGERARGKHVPTPSQDPIRKQALVLAAESASDLKRLADAAEGLVKSLDHIATLYNNRR